MECFDLAEFEKSRALFDSKVRKERRRGRRPFFFRLLLKGLLYIRREHNYLEGGKNVLLLFSAKVELSEKSFLACLSFFFKEVG